MTKKKLPESHESHINSDISFKNLRDVLPEHWKIVPLRDDKSGNEYGQDWLVQMTNENNRISGEEFRVQSKVISQKTSKRRIGDRIKVSTLNYLSEIPIPVMLHFFDNTAKCGYWMWLEDWYSEHYSSNLESKREVTVYVPKRNLFDETAVKQIRSRVQIAFHRMNLLKKADVATKLDQDYAYQATFGLNSVAIGVYAKHDKARPLSFKMELNEEANKIFQRLYERGEAVSFEGTIYHEEELPDFLKSDDGIHEIIAIPHTPDRSFPARIEFFDIDESLLYRIPYVQFHLIQEGSQFKKWEGLGVSDSLLCVLEEDLVEQTSLIQVRRNKTNKTLVAFANFVEFRKLTATSKNIKHTNLITDKITVLPVPEQNITGLTPEGMIWEQLVKALMTIEKNVDIAFDMPETLSGENLYLTDLTADVVSEGYTFKRFGFFIQIEQAKKLVARAKKSIIQQTIEEFNAMGKAACMFDEIEPVVVELFDHRIELGKFTYVFGIKNILNSTQLDSGIDSDDPLFEIQAEVDWDNTFAVFENWSSKLDNISE